LTNRELKVVLQKMLDDGTLNVNTVAMLQDASIHVAQKLGLDLTSASASYTLLASAHDFMEKFLGIDITVLDVIEEEPVSLQDFLKELRGQATRSERPEAKEISDQERKQLNALLKDVDFKFD
jgi:hypothetical protein